MQMDENVFESDVQVGQPPKLPLQLRAPDGNLTINFFQKLRLTDSSNEFAQAASFLEISTSTLPPIDASGRATYGDPDQVIQKNNALDSLSF